MIGSIRGKIALKTEKFLIIETGGIGYKVNVLGGEARQSGPSLASPEEVFFWIHTHVREDSLDLYGFANYQELEFFEMLINVSGIGPRGALTILNIASIETLGRAIGTGDIGYLTKISGIGKKTAEKMVIELRDKILNKIKNQNDQENPKENIGSLREELDVLEALKTLGYSQNEAREAVKKVSQNADINTKIREALKILGGK